VIGKVVQGGPEGEEQDANATGFEAIQVDVALGDPPIEIRAFVQHTEEGIDVAIEQVG